VTPSCLNLLTDDIRRGEDRVVTTFLLSTDFFELGSDEARAVHYVDFFDPLRCGNPFARFGAAARAPK
jgi:hypothetical protein